VVLAVLCRLSHYQLKKIRERNFKLALAGKIARMLAFAHSARQILKQIGLEQTCLTAR